MRLSVSIVALAVAGVLAHAHDDSNKDGNTNLVRRRKTLGFGPELPHATFKAASEMTASVTPAFTRDDAYVSAEWFVRNMLKKDGVRVDDHDSSYLVREDSYHDERTGVTHIYFRQLINGIEVADANINVNIKDGKVISYGDSFYRGVVPPRMTSPAVEKGLRTTTDENCFVLLSQLHAVRVAPSSNNNGQTVLGGQTSEDTIEEYALDGLFQDNCVGTSLLALLPQSQSQVAADGSPILGEARHAALQFMLAATPKTTLAKDIYSQYESYANGISSSFEDTLLGSHIERVEYLHGVPDTVNPVKARLAYVQVPNGDKTELSLVWKLEVEMQDNWYEAAVSAHPPHNIVSVVDWASDASEKHFRPVKVPKKPTPGVPEPEPVAEQATYDVFPWGVNDPSCGKRSTQNEYVDKLASPIGWHAIPVANDPKSKGVRYLDPYQVVNYTTTWGNNVFAHENWEGRNQWEDNYRPDAGPSKVFDYKYQPKERDNEDSLAEAKKYINATVTQLFYTVNMVHDLYYRYGFDEVSGNFQQHNFGRGGKENDAVIANAQDGSGYNNANFMTPPDGQNGRCRMYLWNTANPYRDGDLEAGIVIHELSHGLSTRLTGGPSNSGCLGWGESGGMGEGWGDFLATMIRSTSKYSDFPMGAWAANREKGIRNYPYSLNNTVNPSTYKTLDKPGYWGVHAIGEVWAEILWVVANQLIKKHGFTDSLFPPAVGEDGDVPVGVFYRPRERDASGRVKPLVPRHGNSLIIQLVLDGMKLQPCMPSFFDARDAIIQADQVLTGGENFCEIWNGFAERGLGTDASVQGRTPWGGGVRKDGFKVPKACEESAPEEPEPEEPGDGDDDGDDDDDGGDDWPWVVVW